MAENVPIEKSCGSPQLLPGNEPNNEWLPEQLGTYARTQYQQIVDGETHLTRPYCAWGMHWKSPRGHSDTASGTGT